MRSEEGVAGRTGASVRGGKGCRYSDSRVEEGESVVSAANVVYYVARLFNYVEPLAGSSMFAG